MKFAELKKHLQSGPLKPAYLITGDDAFLVLSAAGHFEKLITSLPELNLSVFNDASDARAVLDACETLPVLSEKRLVLCYDFKGDGADFLSYIEKPNPASVLVFISGKLPDNLVKVIPKLEIVDCGKLEGAHAARWMNTKLSETGTLITDAARELLMNYCGGYMTRVSRETEKLGVYKAGGVINEEDVRLLVTPDEEYKIFELSEAASNKNSAKTAAVLNRLLESGTPPVTLLGMLYGHFRRLLYCSINPRDAELPKKLGVKEYAVKVAIREARAYSPVRLKRICDDFHRLDFAVKSGEIGDKTGLEVFILKILLES